MPEAERDLSILKHIVSYCEDIENAVSRFGDGIEAFAGNKDYHNACAMYILQIGELVNHLSQEFRTSHPGMPWNEIRSMHNVMAHAYGSISIQTT